MLLNEKPVEMEASTGSFYRLTKKEMILPWSPLKRRCSLSFSNTVRVLFSSFLLFYGRKESGVGSNALCVKLLIVAFLWTSENQTL